MENQPAPLLTPEQLSISIECQRKASHQIWLLSKKQITDVQVRHALELMPDGFGKEEYRKWLNHFKRIMITEPETKKQKPLWRKDRGSRHEFRRGN